MTQLRFRPLTIAVAAGMLLAVLYGIIALAVHARSSPPAALKPLALTRNPKAVPQVAFTDAEGNSHTLAQFKGGYVLLNLWAPWCAPCVRELPALARLQAALPRGRLSVVAVDVGRGSAADAHAFLVAHGAGALGVYVDSDIALVRTLGAYGLPLSVVIDPKGKEFARAEGAVEWSSKDSVAYFKKLTAR